ncbi:TIGR04540 family protein [Solibacillus merdavium]|uniref:TIGR04540 family protein n=1 Tax=Solibacillus merdavium TaxID=2762218 RepID=A0ABR8XRL3_9BACL|nr:TIGR04540 family protein [Solibacillus merdavium]MBD8034593.1 TIGR04540 family protein [Solibacillus merdavium]
MELKRFYRTQRELAIALNQLIDSYWENEINEDELMGNIKVIYENNNDKLLKGNDYTKVVLQQCGKRRLSIVSKILDISKKNSIV